MPRPVLPLLLCLLAACASAHAPAGKSPAGKSASVARESADAAREVDLSCSEDADCAVKNVGSCCGYHPACVNQGSATFPEQVKAQCAKDGMMSTCGFQEISGCTCIDGTCKANAGVGGDSQVQ